MAKEQVLHLTKKDFEFQAFRSGGKGGQNQNKTSSGCRVIHRASGARAESRSSRSWEENRRIAFRRMAESPRFRMWVAEQHARFEGIEQQVKEMMAEENLKVEVWQDGSWDIMDV